jgi:C4-dicarboxylate-specific signal transduction histidine kinase
MVRERIHPEDIPLFDEVITRAANGDGFDCEYRLLLPSGTVKQVHVVAHAVRGEFGSPEFVGAVMDITVTRQAEAALRQAQAQLAHVTRVTTMAELAASIAHEVNQPIAGVMLNGNASLRWLARSRRSRATLRRSAKQSSGLSATATAQGKSSAVSGRFSRKQNRRRNHWISTMSSARSSF